MLPGREILEKKYKGLRLLREVRGIETWVGESSIGLELIKLNPDSKDRFRSEYDFLNSFQHPSFPKPYSWQRISGVELYSREFIPGDPISKYFGKLNTDWRSLTAQTARALAALHDRGWAHGDLSAHNILVTPEGRAVLIDFEFLSLRHQTPSAIRGTLTTMAPELFWKRPPTIQTDLYALGCLLYALISGDYPFQGETFQHHLQNHILKIPPDPVRKRPEIPREVGFMTLRLLAKDPAQRFAAANDILATLNRIFKEQEPLEPSLPRVSTEKRIVLEEGFNLDREAIEYFKAKPDRKEDEQVMFAEFLLKQERLEELEQQLAFLPPEQAWLFQGILWNRKGQYQVSKEHFLGQKQLLEGNLRASMGLATSFYYTGEIDQALSCLKSVLEKTNSEDPEWPVLANFQGNLLLFQRKSGEARDMFQRALTASRELGMVQLEALVLMNLANVETAEHCWQEALEHYQSSGEIYEALGLKRESAKVELNLCGLMRFLGHFERADQLLDRAQENLKSCPNIQLTSYANLLRSDLEKKRGHFKAAIQQLQSIEKELETHPSLADQGDFYVSLLELNLSLELWDSAEILLVKVKNFGAKGSDTLLLKRATFLEEILKAFRSQSLEEATLQSMASTLVDEGDVEFVLDNLLRSYRLAWRQKYRWTKSLQSAGRQFLKDVLPKIPADYRIFFKNIYRDIGEETFMNSVEPFRDFSPSVEVDPLLQWVRELTGELDLTALTQKVLNRMLDLTRMERGFVLLKDGRQLNILQSHHMPTQDLPPRQEETLSWTLTRQALESGEPLFTLDAAHDERISSAFSVEALALRSILVLPFHWRGQVLGAVYLDSRMQGEEMTPRSLSYLSGLSGIIGLAVHNATEFRKKSQDLERMQRALDRSQEDLKIKYRYDAIVGNSPPTRRFLQRVDRVTDILVPVLILGESGVGKELVAKAIHYNGPRKNGPFISANCTAIPETLMESELFGHERGAFTGAIQTRIGLFEEADGGTLFFDEIGDMPLTAQGKLLRVLQDGEVRRIGGNSVSRVDVRILTATHRDLRAEVKNGQFREDLFYRLSVAEIMIPPLRERIEDIPILVDRFLNLFSEKNNIPKKKLDPKALSLLMECSWPGNIRELENLIYNLCVFANGDHLPLEDFLRRTELDFRRDGRLAVQLIHSQSEPLPVGNSNNGGEIKLSKAKRQFEREQIVRALSLCGGKVGEAAKHLGMPRPQLSRLLKYHKLDKNLVANVS